MISAITHSTCVAQYKACLSLPTSSLSLPLPRVIFLIYTYCSVCVTSLNKVGTFSVLFIAASPVPRIGPGTYKALNKRSLKKKTNVYRKSSVKA